LSGVGAASIAGEIVTCRVGENSSDFLAPLEVTLLGTRAAAAAAAAAMLLLSV